MYFITLKSLSLAKLNSLVETVISVISHTNFGVFGLWWVSMMSYIKNYKTQIVSAKKWAINCVHRRSGSWDIPLSAAKIGVATRKCMETALLALDEELQEIALNQKCSPECQLEVESSTAFVGCQIQKIFHFLWQKLVSQLSKLYGNGYFGYGWRVTRDSIRIVLSKK